MDDLSPLSILLMDAPERARVDPTCCSGRLERSVGTGGMAAAAEASDSPPVRHRPPIEELRCLTQRVIRPYEIRPTTTHSRPAWSPLEIAVGPRAGLPEPAHDRQSRVATAATSGPAQLASAPSSIGGAPNWRRRRDECQPSSP